MPFFVVAMSHPDGNEWGQHLRAHVDYLKKLVAEGSLRASGRLKGKRLRSGFLIIKAASVEEVTTLIHADPFYRENLIAELTINEWEPFLGVFASETEGLIPELGGSI